MISLAIMVIFNGCTNTDWRTASRESTGIAPDRHWYGEKPRLLIAHQGEGVDELIAAVDETARAYPLEKTYKAFTGPNSNTFTAWVAEQVPELQLDLPFSAIGKGYVD